MRCKERSKRMRTNRRAHGTEWERRVSEQQQQRSGKGETVCVWNCKGEKRNRCSVRTACVAHRHTNSRVHCVRSATVDCRHHIYSPCEQPALLETILVGIVVVGAFVQEQGVPLLLLLLLLLSVNARVIITKLSACCVCVFDVCECVCISPCYMLAIDYIFRLVEIANRIGNSSGTIVAAYTHDDKFISSSFNFWNSIKVTGIEKPHILVFDKKIVFVWNKKKKKNKKKIYYECS